jgi:cyanuric acid amidohydrolase
MPEEVGTMTQVREVAAAVKKAQAEAGITDASDVHYVQVKGQPGPVEVRPAQ